MSRLSVYSGPRRAKRQTREVSDLKRPRFQLEPVLILALALAMACGTPSAPRVTFTDGAAEAGLAFTAVCGNDVKEHLLESTGNGIAVVRLSTASNEGKLWAHELGHNTGLGHNPSNGFIMFGSLSGGNTRVNSAECFRYHNPSGSAGLSPVVIGECHDDDQDQIASNIDNCPDTANPNQ